MSQPEIGAQRTGRLRAVRPEISVLVGGQDDRQSGRPASEDDLQCVAPDGRDPDPLRPDALERRLPPGQYVPSSWPVLHYGPIPVFNPETWDLRVTGATDSGQEYQWTWPELAALPRGQMVADFHCVTKFTLQGVPWAGIPAAELLRAVPPAAGVTHVMVWADFGYGANVPISAFLESDTILATHRDGAELSPEHGYPLRLVVPSRYAWKSVKWVRAVEYLTRDRRGFWEERGYHNGADPWREQRYSYQEQPGEGPPD
jgi:DMSO/TMAO reductase YedYZ molybdopterin-dependent catalytic subunit